MEYRALGAGGPVASRIGLGTMGYGGRYDRVEGGEADAVALVHLALDLGITLFDTAEVYGAGHGEEVLGQALRGRRDRALIATKFDAAHSRPGDLKAACEASLRRLGVETIDLYQTHWPNPDVPVADTLGAMADLVRAGKVRAVGLSNCTASEATAARAALPADIPLASVQQDYSLHQRFAERRVLPWARDTGVAMIAYSPLGQGRVAGDDPRMARLSALAHDAGLAAAQLMLAWALRDDAVFAIPMTGRAENLRANATALDTPVPPAVLAELDALFAQRIEDIAPSRIAVEASHHGRVMTTLEEARANVHAMAPSPAKLAETLADGELLKPVKVRAPAAKGARYRLIEGQLRYWAWVIAHGWDRPIPALVADDLGAAIAA